MWSKLSPQITRFFIASGILTVISIILGLVLPKFPAIDSLMKEYGYYILGAILIIFLLREFGIVSNIVNTIFSLTFIYRISNKPGKIFKKMKVALNNFFVISGIILIATVSIGLLLPQFPLLDLLIKNYALPSLFMCMTIVFGWHLNFKSLYLSVIIIFLFGILFTINIFEFQGEILGLIEYILLFIFLIQYKSFIHETK